LLRSFLNISEKHFGLTFTNNSLPASKEAWELNFQILNQSKSDIYTYT
jgi:hypothetical protein